MADLQARQQRNLQLAQSLLDAFQRGDLEAAREYPSPDEAVAAAEERERPG
jgi:hypothetical protein